MKAKLLNQEPETTYAVVFDAGDEFLSGLTAFAKEQGLTASHFTAIGAFERATLGFFNMQRKEYTKIPVTEQVEVLSLVGDIALNDGEPKIHAHVVVGAEDGTARGGHILEAHVRPTLEVLLVETPKHLQRETDAKTGLPLIRL